MLLAFLLRSRKRRLLPSLRPRRLESMHWNPVLSCDDLKLARREMDDASFLRDRLTEAASRLAERVAKLKALEADRRMWAEHERVLADC